MKVLIDAASTLAIGFALTGAVPAFAQQTGAGAPPAQAPGEQATPADATHPAPEFNGIGDIIVTASRRSETLQRTAIPVTAITAEALTARGVENVNSITQLVPAIKIGQIAGSGFQVTLRGIGNFGGNSFAEPGVAFNLDGVYVARSAGAAGIFYDVDRVEVLKGPQGTLYGRNSTGGVVNLLTKDPGKEFGFDFTGEYGNVNRIRAEAGVTVPVADWLSVRIAGQRTISDGFTTDGGGSEDNYAARIKVKITPTDALSVLIEADYAKVNDGVLLGGFNVPGYNPYYDATCGPTSLQNSVIPNAPAGAPYPPGFRVLPLIQCNAFNDNSSRGVQGTINYDLGPVAATLIVANRENTQNDRHYGAGFPVTEDTTGTPSEYTTVELRLASGHRDSRLKWVLGGFFYDDDLHSPLTFDQGVTYTKPDIHVFTKSYSGFAEATFAVTPRFRLTAGGRYTSDEKNITGYAIGPVGAPFAPFGAFPSAAAAAASCPTAIPGVTYNPAPSFGPETGNVFFAGSCTTPITGAKTYNKFTYKGGAEFDLSPTSLLYATVSTGFKSGGFYASLDTTGNAALPANQRQGNSYLPETLMAYTVGAKNRFFDDTVQLNLEGYYWRYKNKQYSHLGIVQPGNAANLIVDNAGAADIYGLEAETAWRPTRNDNLSADLQYNHAQYTNFAYTALFQGLRPVTACAVGPVTAGGQFNTARVDCTGRPVSFAPRWTANLAYSHTFDLGDRGRIIAGASTQITSHFYAGEEYLPDEFQSSATVSNAELSWQDVRRRVTVTGFVKNLENQAILNSSFVYPFTGGVRQSFNFPRTYGIRSVLHF